MERQAGDQENRHRGKARVQRREIAASLGKLSCLPRGNRIHQAEHGCQREVVPVSVAEVIAHQEVEVVEIENRPEGVQSFERKTAELDNLARGHCNTETSSIALRQYHFTASDIGGCSV